MNKNDQLYEKALDAIRELFSDGSVSRDIAKANMHNLKDDIDDLIDALEADDP